MTSIIQSNRERKSRLDEGLVERLNKALPSKQGNNDIVEPANGSVTELMTALQHINEYGMKKFPKTWYSISKSIQMNNNVLVGANPYYAVSVDMFFKEQRPEYRLATLVDVQNNLSTLQGIYSADVGIAIRKRNGKNRKQAINIVDQIGNSLTGYWINLRDLEIDDELNFKLTTQSVYQLETPLNWPSGTGFSVRGSLGLPMMDDPDSDTRLYTCNAALARGMINHRGDIICTEKNLLANNPQYTIAITKVK